MQPCEWCECSPCAPWCPSLETECGTCQSAVCMCDYLYESYRDSFLD